MLVENVDIKRIEALIKSLPGKMEIIGIDFTNGYSAKLVAGEQEINNAAFEAELKKLNELLSIYNNKNLLDK